MKQHSQTIECPAGFAADACCRQPVMLRGVPFVSTRCGERRKRNEMLEMSEWLPEATELERALADLRAAERARQG